MTRKWTNCSFCLHRNVCGMLDLLYAAITGINAYGETGAEVEDRLMGALAENCNDFDMDE